MSFENFVPTVWAETINMELERKCVAVEDCNREYEGKVSKLGDSVNILGIGDVSVRDFEDGKNHTLEDPEEVESTNAILVIKKYSDYNFKVDDIDKRQGVNGVMEKMMKSATRKLANKQDKFVLSMASDPLLHCLDKTPVKVTVDNVLGMLNKAQIWLFENDVPPEEELIVTCPPTYIDIVRTAYEKLDTNNHEMLKNGYVGEYHKIKFKQSNNCYKDGNNYKLAMKTKEAFAFARPMIHSEPYRMEKGFSDAVKGFVLYDGKVVKPKEAITLNIAL